MTDNGDQGKHMAYAIMLNFGMAMLLAYNSFISSPTYVSKLYQYASDDPNATTSMPSAWENMETIIVIMSMIPNFICQFYVVSPHGQKLSIRKRILISICALTVAVLIVLIMPFAKPGEKTAMGLFLLGVAISGASAAFFQSSSFGLGSMLSENNIQAAMLGIGVSGSVTSLILIIIKAASNDSDFASVRHQATMFFAIAVAWLVLCFVLALYLPRISFVRNRVPEFGGHLDFDSRAKLLDDPPSGHLVSAESPLTDANNGTESRGILRIIRCIWPTMLANFLVYLNSLTIFPQLCANAANASDWFGVIVIFLFNFGDTCGRFVCRFRAVHINARYLLPASIVRFVFVPLIIICVHPQLITNVWFPYIVMFLVGITNGYVSSLCMMYGPSSPALLDCERANAGSAMSLSLLGGCSAGSLLALLVNAFVQPPN
jgi:equilibrative nucleoside transporter 1/2/3